MFKKIISKLFGTYTKTKNIIDNLQADKVFIIKSSFEGKSNFDYLIYSFILDENIITIKKKVSHRLRNKGYELYINDRYVFASESLLNELYQSTVISYNQSINITKRICSYIYPHHNSKHITEILERIEEFEVIKNCDIDYISLESLLEFYEIKYNIEHIKKEIKIMRNRPKSTIINTR